MGKTERFVISMIVVLLGAIALVKQTKAECCDSGQFVRHNFIGKWCHSYICPDGTLLYQTRHCGVGSCNIFGCNCDGGCRRNSKGFDEDEAQALFLERYKTHIKCVAPKKVTEEYILCMNNL